MPAQRSRLASVRQYAANLDEQGNLPLNRHSVPVWRCKLCHKWPKEYVASAGTANFSRHIREAHRIYLSSSKADSIASESQSTQQLLCFRDDTRVPTIEGHKDESNLSRALFLDWIITDDLPFTLVASPRFRTFLQSFSPSINATLPRAPSTINQDLKVYYNIHHDAIKHAFALANSKFHVLCDAWTSPNGFAYWGIQVSSVQFNSVQLN